MWLRSLCVQFCILIQRCRSGRPRVSFALDYRMEFGEDVFIDLLGYRKYGHNEGDEPRFTNLNCTRPLGIIKTQKRFMPKNLLMKEL